MFLFDIVAPMTMAEAQTDYSKCRQRERDVDAGKPVARQPKNPQTDYARKRAKEKKELELGENAWNDGSNDWTSEHDQWTKEDAQISPDSTSPVGGNVQEDEVEEGWSNKMVAQRTGQAPTPYSVYIKGKEWKSFADDDHAENVADKLRAKFKQEGRDPSVITIAATGYDKGVAEADPNAPYTPSPAKPFRNPPGFNKKRTAIGNRFADLNRAELANIQPSKGTPVPAKSFAQGIEKDLQKAMAKPKIQVKKNKGVAEDGEGTPEGLPHLTKELLTHIVQQVGTEGAHAIVKSLEWGDGAAKELLQLIVKDLKNNIKPNIDEHIVKVKGGYELKSKHGNKNLGKYPTKAGAEKRERQVQYFKHAGEGVDRNAEPQPTGVKKKNEFDNKESTNYGTKLQNDRTTKLNSLVNELNESIKK